MKEQVDHPDHYGGRDDPFETIKVLQARLTRDEFVGFLKGNIYKYNDRARGKGSELIDYRKALWYQQRLVDYLQEGLTKS